MSTEFHQNSTGHEMVDALQGIQKVADNIDQAAQKIEHVKRAMSLLATRTLLDKHFMVSALQVLGKDPSSGPDDRVVFNSNMVFVAKLDSFAYLLDNGVPVDSLALNFSHPDIIGLDERDDRKLRDFMFQVPVLAIEACINA